MFDGLEKRTEIRGTGLVTLVDRNRRIVGLQPIFLAPHTGYAHFHARFDQHVGIGVGVGERTARISAFILFACNFELSMKSAHLLAPHADLIIN